MTEISKLEKEIIVEKFPDVHIVRTMKQKSKRHHYYCEEAPRVMRLLNRLRNTDGEQKARTHRGSGEKK